MSYGKLGLLLGNGELEMLLTSFSIISEQIYTFYKNTIIKIL